MKVMQESKEHVDISKLEEFREYWSKSMQSILDDINESEVKDGLRKCKEVCEEGIESVLSGNLEELRRLPTEAKNHLEELDMSISAYQEEYKKKEIELEELDAKIEESSEKFYKVHDKCLNKFEVPSKEKISEVPTKIIFSTFNNRKQ